MFLPMLLSLVISCGEVNDTPVEYPPVQAGTLEAGAAEGHLELPIGTPLGCFSARCRCLVGVSYQDRRKGPYNTGFDESTGIHTRPTIKVVWLDNGDIDMVLIKWDACMANDELVGDLTRRLEEATGRYLEGRVTLSASHTHSGYGGYQDQWHWYLGTDRQNQEIYQRTLNQMVEVALDAWNSREDAAIGMGWAFNWDPNNRVYSDRRGDNNDLIVWEDQQDWENGKDPHLGMIRIDTAAGEPIAVVPIFGMHGIIMDADNPIVTGDSSGGLERALQEEFDREVVVMHLQGAGGDASPRGSDSGWAKMETIGEYGRDPIMQLWQDTPTTTAPISIETAARHIWTNRSQIHVSREGTVDWTYADAHPEDINWRADDIIYDEAGEILSPIDEFNAQYGAAFCGESVPLIPGTGFMTDIFPYTGCVKVEGIAPIVAVSFGYTLDDIEMPFKEDVKAGSLTALLGDIPTLKEDGSIVEEPLMIGFMPGEPVALYAEQWRRRVEAEMGYDHPILVGYSMDHEGYLMIPEDWLIGGYEPSIAVWGPLQGEHIMEGTLDYSKQFLGTDIHEDPDPTGYYAATEYDDDKPLPTHHPTDLDDSGNPVALFPDHTPNAGTRISTAPEDYWVPRMFRVDADGDGEFEPQDLSDFPAQVPRVQGLIEMGWIGGDPMVDPPHVYLERDNAGTWERVTSRSGREVSEAWSDIMIGYTPDPLFPHDAQQTHYYWAMWQAVGSVHNRTSLPLGTYRLKVEGEHYTGNSETWPWDSEPYEMASESFEIVPAVVSIEPDVSAPDTVLWAWMQADDRGYRLVDLEGSSRGANPVRGTVSVFLDDGTDTGPTIDVEVTEVANGKAKISVDTTGYIGVGVTDEYGNSGYIALP